MREKRNKKETIDTPAEVATGLFFSGIGIVIIIAAIVGFLVVTIPCWKFAAAALFSSVKYAKAFLAGQDIANAACSTITFAMAAGSFMVPVLAIIWIKVKCNDRHFFLTSFLLKERQICFCFFFLTQKKGSPYGPPFYSTFRHISQVQQKTSYNHITGYSPLQVLTNRQQQCVH